MYIYINEYPSSGEDKRLCDKEMCMRARTYFDLCWKESKQRVSM